jgi:hypothetical protein
MSDPGLVLVIIELVLGLVFSGFALVAMTITGEIEK